MVADAVSCPVCLVSSTTADNDNQDDHHGNNDNAVIFVKTSCDHTFCFQCIERVLLKPRRETNRLPTRGPCPMCRETVNLFDLNYLSTSGENDDNRTTSLPVVGIDADVSSWPSEFSSLTFMRCMQVRTYILLTTLCFNFAIPSL